MSRGWQEEAETLSRDLLEAQRPMSHDHVLGFIVVFKYLLLKVLKKRPRAGDTVQMLQHLLCLHMYVQSLIQNFKKWPLNTARSVSPTGLII